MYEEQCPGLLLQYLQISETRSAMFVGYFRLLCVVSW